MDKRQLIEQIRQHNPTASQDFLMQFDEDSLEQYLHHLEDAKAHTRQISSWTRPREKMKMAV